MPRIWCYSTLQAGVEYIKQMTICPILIFSPLGGFLFTCPQGGLWLWFQCDGIFIQSQYIESTHQGTRLTVFLLSSWAEDLCPPEAIRSKLREMYLYNSGRSSRSLGPSLYRLWVPLRPACAWSWTNHFHPMMDCSHSCPTLQLDGSDNISS